MLLLRMPYGEEKTFALVPGRPKVQLWASNEDAPPNASIALPSASASVHAALVTPDSNFGKGRKSNHHGVEPIERCTHNEESPNIPATTAETNGTFTRQRLRSACALSSSQSRKSRSQEMAESHVNGSYSKSNGHTTASAHGHRVKEGNRTLSNGSPATSSNGLSIRPASTRKPSNPLAPSFIVSAPGKVIVYGEHAVVHGKAAIAAAISLRSYLLCTTLSKSKKTVTLRFPDIGLDHTWTITDLPWKAFAHPQRKKKYYDLVTSLDQELVTAMQPFITDVSPGEKVDSRKIHQAAASCFLYLFLSLGSEASAPCIYTLRSTIPIAAGLGSSASISVCLSAAMLIQCRALAGPHPDQQGLEAEEQLERINRWAFVGELLIHGNPSGVDNTVSTNGHAVLFQRKDYAKPPSVKILREFPELPLLLVNTCQSRSTAVEVAKVGTLKTRHPAVTESILESIGSITRSVHECISDEDFDPRSVESIAHLGELMSINHSLLASLGVSHPRLERLRYLVDQAGVGWTKLTGAGGGGCAITLLKPLQAKGVHLNGEAAMDPTQSDRAALDELEMRFDEEGFQKYEATLGGDGVGVLYPAIIDDQEIDQELFLTAHGRKGIEDLVGGKNDCDAWKYWRP